MIGAHARKRRLHSVVIELVAMVAMIRHSLEIIRLLEHRPLAQIGYGDPKDAPLANWAAQNIGEDGMQLGALAFTIRRAAFAFDQRTKQGRQSSCRHHVFGFCSLDLTLVQSAMARCISSSLRNGP